MKTTIYRNAGIDSQIVDKGNFCVVQIIRVWRAEGVDDSDEPILTFSKHFSCNDHAKVFMTSKTFKSVLKAVEKSQMTYHQ